MHKTEVRKRMITVLIVGFATLILLLWTDDVFDLPKLFGMSVQSILFEQTVIVSLLAAALCGWLLLTTSRILKRLQYLEGFLSVCSFCKRIHVDEQWIPIEIYISQRTDTKFSHGLCEACKEKHYGEFLRQAKDTALKKEPQVFPPDKVSEPGTSGV
jgi:hypothetical protein